MSDDYDSPWKEVLERFFPQFMEFFFPDAHREIDWQKGWQSCDQELQQIVRDAELGKRLADKVMKVFRLRPSGATELPDGEELYVYAHIEVQGQHDAGFPERMFVYNYRLYDRHGRPVVSLAILGDDSRRWRPDAFGYEMWGCQMRLRFPVVKLRDYESRWAELETSANPFAVVVMAHLKTRATRPDDESRLQWKLRLIRHVYAAAREPQEVPDLLRFIDWMMKLSPELETRLEPEVKRIDAEAKMQYVTSWERRARERGLEQGIEQGLEQGIEQGLERGLLQGEATVLRRLLKRRFARLPQWVEERLKRASREELERWTDRVIEAEALEEVFA